LEQEKKEKEKKRKEKKKVFGQEKKKKKTATRRLPLGEESQQNLEAAGLLSIPNRRVLGAQNLENPVDHAVIGVVHAGGNDLAGLDASALVNDAEQEITGSKSVGVFVKNEGERSTRCLRKTKGKNSLYQNIPFSGRSS